jgi:hypothetical protein
VRIIGICQDMKANDRKAGLTFQFTHALATTHEMNVANTNNGGWGSTNMRTWLNNDVYNALPDDLRDNIASVEKYYQSPYDSTSISTVASTNDKLFLLSMRELYDYTDSSYPWYEFEGAGSKHNEQYSYYAYKSATTSKRSLLPNMHREYNGANPGSYTYWWLWSASGKGGDLFWYVNSSGHAYSSHDAGLSFSVVPCFSL